MARALIWSAGWVLLVTLARGQITESPHPVAPGRNLIEMDALSLTFDRNGENRFTGISVANTLLSVGVAANWDIQFGAETFLSQEYRQDGVTERHHGFGDLYVRTKWRIFNDPATGAALAVIPYVKIPTNSGGVGNRSMEGGLIVPWAVALPRAFNLTAMVELDFLRNGAGDGYDTNWYGSMALSRQVTKSVGLYAELAAGKTSGAEPWSGALGGGVTLALSDNFWWDLAVYRGISRSSVEWNPVLRLNWSF